jgi:hypothetical protein
MSVGKEKIEVKNAVWNNIYYILIQVMGLIPDGVIVIFHWHNPSGRTCPEVDSAVNRNEYQEYFLGGGGGGVKEGRC